MKKSKCKEVSSESLEDEILEKEELLGPKIAYRAQDTDSMNVTNAIPSLGLLSGIGLDNGPDGALLLANQPPTAVHDPEVQEKKEKRSKSRVFNKIQPTSWKEKAMIPSCKLGSGKILHLRIQLKMNPLKVRQH